MNTRILLILFVSFMKCNSSNFKLKYVHVFFRHGIRTPDLEEMYVNDPYAEIFKNTPSGELTEEGKQNSCKLGRLLRNRYKNFLPDTYSEDVVYTQSSEKERTNVTAKLVLNGLFFESCNQSSINYYITTKPYELSRVKLYCPKYVKELQHVLNSKKTKSILNKYRNLFRYISFKAKQNYTSFEEIYSLYETLTSEQNCNLTLPLWADKVYKQVTHIAILQLEYNSANEILKRLNGGRMLKKVVDTMQRKIDDASDYKNKKMTLYSGHGYNIANIQSTLNVFKPHMPEYNSAISLELYQHSISKRYYVKIVYFKSIYAKPEKLRMPNCFTMCEFTRFKKNLSPYLPLNYTKECDSQILLD